MRKYTVIAEWAGRSDEFDADEIVVFADSASAAEGKALRKWRMTIGARWPHLRVERIRVYRPRDANQLA